MSNISIPLNHKTIFLFDHSSFFSQHCGQTVEYDTVNSSQKANQASNIQKFEPLSKTLWTCNIEAALEFTRIIYDLFPTEKLIRMLISKTDCPLNGWIESEQTQEHIMNVMGSIPPPIMPTRQLFEGEEFLICCKALQIAVNSLAQISPLQKSLLLDNQSQPPTQFDHVPNSGRIILFSSSKLRKFDEIQEFLNKAIEDCNKNVDQLQRNDRAQGAGWLKINKIELVIIDVVPADQDLLFENEILKLNSNELRTRVLCSKSGKHLTLKMIQLAKNFYELSVTSITNIPMKEELNANSSANYDVDILHTKSLHDQLRIYGLIKHCIVQKDGLDTVCLKWSNPKTNITDFNFSISSSRITPIDVNSRPTSCLISFLLGGRCVVLEVIQRGQNNRVASHVLFNQGNEIYMHCLNFSGKSNFEDRPSIENMASFGRLADYRTQEFIELMKANLVTNNQSMINPHAKASSFVNSAISKLDKSTRKWPLIYSDNFVTNLVQLKPLVQFIANDVLVETQYNECIKCIEYFQNAELKNETITTPNHLILQTKEFRSLKKKDQFKLLWTELESYLRSFSDLSDKHKLLYKHVKEIRQNNQRNENLLNYELSLLNNKNQPSLSIANSTNNLETLVETITNASASLNSKSINDFKNRRAVELILMNNYSHFDREFENEKLCKKQRLILSNEAQMSLAQANTKSSSLLDIWSNNKSNQSVNARTGVKSMDFYGRSISVNNVAPLYTSMKLEELTPAFSHK